MHPAMALRHFLLAVQYFTRIPLPRRVTDWMGYDPAWLRASTGWMPLVGLIVGGWSALVWLAAWAWLPAQPATAWICAGLAMAASLWMTGAFHEDGLADTADALGGHVSRQRALEIMKDSRIGSYGAVALVMALGLKGSLLALLAQQWGAQAAGVLAAAHVVSRCMPLITIRLLPHVGETDRSKSKPVSESINTPTLLTGFVLGTALLGLFWWGLPALPWWAGLPGAACGWCWVWWLLRQRLGGFTGDGLGATQQLAELGFYLGMALAAGRTA